MTTDGSSPETAALRSRHVKIGWAVLVVFLLLGLALETMHGFKVGLYLDVGNETRRLLFTLAHAHGALLSLVHVVFGLSLVAMPGFEGAPRRLASRCLTAALVLMPAGFFLGGLTVRGGDPGLGVLLVPPGGLLLVLGVALTARGAR